MPNWCNNTITIGGPNSMIDKIEKIVNEEKDAGGLLNFMSPIPPALKDTVSGSESAKPDWQKKNSAKLIKEYGYDNWYDWCLNNWGTKWDICEYYNVSHNEINDYESSITFSFDSAWSPPLTSFETFIDNHSDCSLVAWYYEGGCDFMGKWDNGIDDCWSPSDHKANDRFWDTDVGQELHDKFGILDIEDFQEEEEVGKWYQDGKEELKLG